MTKKTILLWFALGSLPSMVRAEEESSDDPRREALYEVRFGQLLSDPYRWMENPDDAELRRWVADENARLADQTRGPLFDAVHSELRQILDPSASSAAAERELERLFDDRRLDRRVDIRFRHHARRPVPDVVAPDSGLEFSQHVSPSGRFTLVLDADANRDLGRLAIVDHQLSTTTKARLPDSLTVRFASVFWETDDRFLYTTGITGRSSGPQFGLYRHRRGTEQAQDELLFGLSEPGAYFALIRAGGEWFIDGFVNGESTFGRFDIATGTIEPLFPSQREIFSVLAYDGTSFYFADFRDDPLGEIVSYAANGTRRVIISQRELGERALDIVFSPPIKAGDAWVVSVIDDTVTRILIVDPASGQVNEVPLPFEGSALVRKRQGKLTVWVSDHTTGSGRYVLDTAKGELLEKRPPPPAPLGLDLVSERVRYTAHNGQPTPIWVVRARDSKLSRETPMVLLGYGGFRISNRARLRQTYAPWYKRGGALAVVTLPGGSEYGADWHRAGRRSNKTNVFADFEAAGERLVNLGYTRRRRLVASGASNGGLLVGAVINRRPRLFGAAVPEVGVMDMLRFELFTAGSFWTDEYGSSFSEEDFQNLLAISPYHNIRTGRESRDYPAVLVVTGDLDDRVIPGHSFKYAARLMNRSRSSRPINMLTETWANHGHPIQLDERIRSEALRWTFVMQAVGIVD